MSHLGDTYRVIVYLVCAHLFLLHAHSLDESISIVVLLFELHLLSSQFVLEVIHLQVCEGGSGWGECKGVRWVGEVGGVSVGW